MIPLFYKWSRNAGSVAGQDLSSYSSLYVTCSATAINLICIVVLNKVMNYFLVAFRYWLRDLYRYILDSNHRSTVKLKLHFSIFNSLQLYFHVAKWLTDMECPRTFTDYEDSFTFKIFLFQFINYYASLFYLAFFKVSWRMK